MGIGRSENMRRIRSKNTRPEIAVRQLLRQMGYAGYRLHRKDLPGKPDIAFVGRKSAIFVHGCFWHSHDCQEGVRRPKSNSSYWLPKILTNAQRDETHVHKLRAEGWSVLTVWECQLRNTDKLIERLRKFLEPREQ